MKKKIKLGLFGFGVVGQGFYELARQGDFSFEIKKIGVRNMEKPRTAPARYFTTRADELLDDPEIDIIVEAISETKPAFQLVSQALEKGKLVASASKKMLATHIDELLGLQAKHGYRLRYEAAVAGAIPILNLLEGALQHEKITRLEGILNGTCNYILTRMRKESLSFYQALQFAQQEGFAEADPTLDISGQDAAYKLSLLALHAFGEVLPPDGIDRKGIDGLSEAAVQGAGRLGQRYRLIATLGSGPAGSLQAAVRPGPIASDNLLYQVEEELNAVQLTLSGAGPQAFTGRGAGAHATGSALLADVLQLLNGQGYGYKKYKAKQLAALP